MHYPLRVKVCHRCWLVQTEDYARAEELFRADYAYFSSTSSSWLDHAADYARMITERLQLGPELRHRGGLQRWLPTEKLMAAGIPCLGIEPTASTAAAAESLGIPGGNSSARRGASTGW